MLHLTSWLTTLPIMVIGMLGIVLVIGVIVLAVMLLNRLTGDKASAVTVVPYDKLGMLCK